MRDLVQTRATAVRVLAKARQHLQRFPLRHERIYHGARAWTLAYRRWLTTVRFEHPADRTAGLHSCCPGIDLKHVVLRIGARIDPGKYQGLQPVHAEYNVGHFAPSFTLSKQNRPAADQRLEDGVLTLTRKKAREAPGVSRSAERRRAGSPDRFALPFVH
jgi:hypothetical protein